MLPQLGTSWLDCSLIFSRGGVSSPLSDAVAGALDRYQREYPDSRLLNVWWDHRNHVCFSGAETRTRTRECEFHFNDDRDGFLVRKWGTAFVRRQIRGVHPFASLPMQVQREAIYGEVPAFRDIKSKSVLIVLGGPSTNRVAWEKLPVHAIWSCNRFYQHPRLRRIDLGLVGLAPNVPLKENAELEAYLAAHPAGLFFELQKVYDHVARDGMRIFAKRYPDRCTYVHLRYASYLGLGSRMICLATLLGARDVYFVGFDGMSEVGTRHSFEPGKRNPTWYLRHGDEVQRRQIVIFWDYLLSLAHTGGVRLYNLAEVVERNGSASIAAMQFPLPSQLRQALLPAHTTFESDKCHTKA